MPVCPDVRTDAVRPSNVPYDTCCQACSRPRHIDQYFERQRLCPGAQGRSGVGGTRPTSAMRNQGDAPAGSASGVCSQDNASSGSAQQERSPSGEQSPAPVGTEQTILPKSSPCRRQIPSERRRGQTNRQKMQQRRSMTERQRNRRARQPFRMMADRTALMINFPLTIGASQHLVITFQCGLEGNTLTGSSKYDVLGLAGNAPTGSSNRSLNSLPLPLI